MELGTTYTILLYAGPLCGIVGFIITPGLTHIRPWLMEKLNKSKKTLTEDVLAKDYSAMSLTDLIKEKTRIENNYKFDLRKKIRIRRKTLKKMIYEQEWKGVLCNK